MAFNNKTLAILVEFTIYSIKVRFKKSNSTALRIRPPPAIFSVRDFRRGFRIVSTNQFIYQRCPSDNFPKVCTTTSRTESVCMLLDICVLSDVLHCTACSSIQCIPTFHLTRYSMYAL